MKISALILKDLSRSFRSVFGLMMMFAIPLLLTGLIWLAFGGMVGGQKKASLPETQVAIVNLDEPPTNAGFSGGDKLVEFLKDQRLSDLIQVTVRNDEVSARQAVRDRQAGVALIIPANFTRSIVSSGGHASLTLVQDPTLSVGPGIVKSLLESFLNGINGAYIAAETYAKQNQETGLAVDPTAAQAVAAQYSAWLQSQEETNGADLPGAVLVSAGSPVEAASPMGSVISAIMAGQMIFFGFWSAANAALSILREDEEGTLARLFTTPTPRSMILASKFAVVGLTLLVNILVLLVASHYLFQIHWGSPQLIGMATTGLVVAGSGFGVMIVSLMKNTRQAGAIIGGGLSLLGMAGGLFTVGFSNLPAALNTISLLTPHGWALRLWQLALKGAPAAQAIAPCLVLIVMGVVFFTAGAIIFQKRYA